MGPDENEDGVDDCRLDASPVAHALELALLKGCYRLLEVLASLGVRLGFCPQTCSLRLRA